MLARFSLSAPVRQFRPSVNDALVMR